MSQVQLLVAPILIQDRMYANMIQYDIYIYIYIYMYIDYNIHICIYLYHSIICHDLSRLFGKQLWLPQIWKNLRETSEYFQSPSECFKLYEVPAEHSDRACSTASWQSILQDSVDPPCWAQAPEAPQQNHHRQNPKRSWKQRRRHFFVPSKSSKILWNLNSWLAKAGPTKSSLECSVSRCPRHTSTFRTLMLCQGNWRALQVDCQLIDVQCGRRKGARPVWATKKFFMLVGLEMTSD